MDKEIANIQIESVGPTARALPGYTVKLKVTPAEFIRARLDEDEATARAAGATQWTWNDEGCYEWKGVGENQRYVRSTDFTADEGPRLMAGDAPVLCGSGDSCGPRGLNVDDGVGEHIARHDPVRVLRQVAALRALVDMYKRDAADRSGDPDYANGREAAGEDAVRQLAGIWSDHPDYDPAWRE